MARVYRIGVGRVIVGLFWSLQSRTYPLSRLLKLWFRSYSGSLLANARIAGPAKSNQKVSLLCPGLRQGSDFPRSGIAPWVAAKGHPWPSAANSASMPCLLIKSSHYAIPALGRPQVAIVSPMRSAHIHRPEICDESGGKYRLKNPQRGFAFHAAIDQTPPIERREAERRCRGVGRSAWMPSERRWAMDGPSARAHTTAPESKEPPRSGGRTSAKMVLVTFVETKVTRPSGRNRHKQRRALIDTAQSQARIINHSNGAGHSNRIRSPLCGWVNANMLACRHKRG